MFESDFYDELRNDDILLKHKSLLKKLAVDDRTVVVGKTKDGDFYLKECCDEWFGHELTKDECIELSELFKELSDKTK